MASVERRSRDGHITWLARWRDDTGRQRKRSFPRKADAQRFVTQVEGDLLRGQYVDPSDRTTVAEYAWQWAKARHHRPSTARNVAGHIRTHIEGTDLGKRRLAAVRPSEVQVWATDRAKHLAPTTLRNVVGLLRSVYASAVLDRLVAQTPVVRLQLPPSHRERVVPLTVDQVRVLAAAMPKRNRAMVITQAGLGLRIGELLALRVQDVNFLKRTARVEFQIAPGSRTRSDPKTRRSRRTIPLPQVVADAIQAHLADFDPAEDGTIFTTRFGAPYSHAYYGAQIFKATVKKLDGVPDSTTPHDLRHHYASVLLSKGESVVAVAERLGHENANLVLSTYGHLMPDSEDRTRRAIDDAWNGAPDVPQNKRKRV
ncbi:tyrosine-type recombinase/integrase [Cryptosporangium aurantiacum]|uniref:Site-specific recombinase XerD n=1 Tax=Cryptosporangium aurantiacum TaxID=134849 RepID=A0A1M7QRY1_9ACTN|nr:site-specific integrase [Cryptosporangium aurantiacum]SHN34069.1 Site-specific recombinase XerD [Cryptosporangium aurantiacum]